MAILSPLQIYQMIAAEDKKNGGKNIDGRATLTFIALMESGGDTQARNDKNNNPPGSVDRGLYQFNNHWHPDVSDAQAYDPVVATAIAYKKTNGLKNFDPWKPDLKILLDPGHQQWQRAFDNIKAAMSAARQSGDKPTGTFVATKDDGIITVDGDGAHDAPTIANTVDDATGGIIPDLGGIGSLVSAVTSLVGKLLTGSFWKRLGIGALGALIIIGALIVVFGKDAADAVKEVASPV